MTKVVHIWVNDYGDNYYEPFAELYNDEECYLSECLWDREQIAYAIQTLKSEGWDVSEVEKFLEEKDVEKILEQIIVEGRDFN